MKKSAGILLYRQKDELQFFLVHPGGPFWAKKDEWSIPKGEFTDDEDPFNAALREFEEETGTVLVNTNAIALSPVKLKSGKIIFAWGMSGDIDASKIRSNIFEIEWPPQSGIKKSFPEIDKGAWFNTVEAKTKISPAQLSLLKK